MDKLEQENQDLWKEKVAASAPHNLAEMMDMGMNPEGKVHQFNPISMTYSQLWSCFTQHSVITPRKTRDRKSRPHWYNPNTRCEFHDGIMGQPIEECKGYPGKYSRDDQQ